jgi:hypothetical protein
MQEATAGVGVVASDLDTGSNKATHEIVTLSTRKSFLKNPLCTASHSEIAGLKRTQDIREKSGLRFEPI